MRQLVRVSVALVAVVPSVALAGTPGIRNTLHDLSMTSASVVTSDTVNEVCIFCHTPHRAQSTQMLWNHAPTKYMNETWALDLDGQALINTTKGTPLPTALRSASKRCLGCHDGSTALGAVSNAGGGKAGTISVVPPMMPANIIGASGSMGGHHPVSVPYAGQNGYNGINSHVPASEVDNGIGNYWKVTQVGCDGASGFCTEAGGVDALNGARVNLISQSDHSEPVGVECPTCHEPHNKYDGALFLRVQYYNTSSLCRSCHNK